MKELYERTELEIIKFQTERNKKRFLLPFLQVFP